jgi:transposase
VKLLVRCPYCGYEGEFRVEKSWRFRFYEVRRLSCPKCGGVFNHYRGVSPKGRVSDFVIRVKPRVGRAPTPAGSG